MTWTRSNSVGRGAGSAPAALARRAVRWGAAGVATAAAVATGLGGVTAASAATAISIPVPCSVTALNAAISLSPSNTILVLKPGCFYVTSGPLSNINRNLTIVGSNDTIRLTGPARSCTSTTRRWASASSRSPAATGRLPSRAPFTTWAARSR